MVRRSVAREPVHFPGFAHVSTAASLSLRSRASWILDTPWQDHERQKKPVFVHQRMPLGPIDFLPVVKAANSTHFGALNRLTVQGRRLRFLIPLQLYSQLDPQLPVEPFESAIVAPRAKVVLAHLPVRKVIGQHRLLTSTPIDVGQRYPDLAQINPPRRSARRGLRKVRSVLLPLRVCKFCWTWPAPKKPHVGYPGSRRRICQQPQG